jgi:hypothetical protein
MYCVLSATGHVLSPQFHVKQDDFFETATGKATDFDSPEPIWKQLAGLVPSVRK